MNVPTGFREITGFSNYCVNDVGEVLNVVTGKAVKTTVVSGTARASLLRDGAAWLPPKEQRQHKKIRVLVLEAFIGPRPPGMEPVSLDGNRLNASLSNLKWGTPEEARRHAEKKQSWQRGSAACG